MELKMKIHKSPLKGLILLTIGSVIFIFGCASSKERASFQTAQNVEKEFSISEQEHDKYQQNIYSTPSGLKQYLKYAALNNPGVMSAFYTWKSRLQKIPQARALMDPQFSYTYYIEEVETRVGPQKQKFGIAQAFPWFGTLALKGGITWEKAEQARLQYEAKKLELFYQVKDAYYDYFFLSRAIAIHKENFELLKQWESVLLKKYATGSAMHGQVIKTQVELGTLEDKIKTFESKRYPIDTRLKSLLNITDTTFFPYPSKAGIDSADVTLKTLWPKLDKNNPNLASLDRKIQMNEKKISLARKKYYPTLMIGLNYIQTDESQMIPSPMDNGKDPLMVGVSLNIPLQLGRISSSVKEAKAGKKSAEHAKKNLENMLRIKLTNLIFKIDDSKRKASLYRKSLVPKALQALEAFEISFRGGQAGFLDLLDAQRVLLNFELVYEKAVSNHQKYLAELEMIVGEEL
jgi:cobalt-zinc-cadmium efflux system outer membrane protein